MPRIVITTDNPREDRAVILLDERIHGVHLSTEHASSQLIERLAWAVSDAEDVELEQLALRGRPGRLERLNTRRQAPSHEQQRRVASA
jgi:hypothetical protein